MVRDRDTATRNPPPQPYPYHGKDRPNVVAHTTGKRRGY